MADKRKYLAQKCPPGKTRGICKKVQNTGGKLVQLAVLYCMLDCPRTNFSHTYWPISGKHREFENKISVIILSKQ